MLLLSVPALAGCALQEEERSTRDELAAMVLPQPTLGPAYAGLVLDEESSGLLDNAEAAKRSLDKKDTREDLIRAGRIDGYVQSFAPEERKKRLAEVSTTVELLRDPAAAAGYLHLRLESYAKLKHAKHFEVTPLAHQSAGVRFPTETKRRQLHTTIVIFRRGRVVATALVKRTDDRDARGETQRLARVLDSRVAWVLAGEEPRDPEPVAASLS